jgi:DNA-binding HxlR family transcriptional regulator
MNRALFAGLVEKTDPRLPTTRFQRYRLTAKGKALRNMIIAVPGSSPGPAGDAPTNRKAVRLSAKTDGAGQSEARRQREEPRFPLLDLLDNQSVINMFAVLKGDMTLDELMNALGVIDAPWLQTRYLDKVVSAGFVEMTVPDKSTGGVPTYRLTAKGRVVQRISMGEPQRKQNSAHRSRKAASTASTESTPSGKPAVTGTSEAAPAEIVPDAVMADLAANRRLITMLSVFRGDMSRREIMKALKLSDSKSYRNTRESIALSAGVIERTIPGKPAGRYQKYRLTPKGAALLKMTCNDPGSGTNPGRALRAGSAAAVNAARMTPQIIRMVMALSGEMSTSELITALGLNGFDAFDRKYVQGAVSVGFIGTTTPRESDIRFQKFSLTPVGKALRDIVGAAAESGAYPAHTPRVAVTAILSILKTVSVLDGEMHIGQIQEALGLKSVSTIAERYLKAALSAELIEKVVPANPHIRYHLYRLTPKGAALWDILANLPESGERPMPAVHTNQRRTPRRASKAVVPHLSRGDGPDNPPEAALPHPHSPHPHIMKLVTVLDGEMSRFELMQALGLTSIKGFRASYRDLAIAAGFVEMTIPERPGHYNQKYRLTPKGRDLRKTLIGKRKPGENPALVPGAAPSRVTPNIERMLAVLKGEMFQGDILQALGLVNVHNFRQVYLNVALSEGLIEIVAVPRHFTRSPRKFRLTPKGEALRDKIISAAGSEEDFFRNSRVNTKLLGLLKVARGEQTRNELMNAAGLSGKHSFTQRYLIPAVNRGLMEMTRPDDPKNPAQKYRLTASGKALLERMT